MHDTLSIPPALDHALATAVLAVLRAQPLAGGSADLLGAHDGTADPATGSERRPGAELLGARLDDVTAQVVAALQAQGATAGETLDALEDAFAALLAAYEAPAQRGVLRALAARARQAARLQLGAGAGDGGAPTDDAATGV